MPQYFLKQAGVSLDDFKGQPGFSGSHDKTIDLVEAGSYETGVLNEQVWLSRVEAGEVDLDKVHDIWRTTPFYDYHWVVRPDVKERYGDDFSEKVQNAFLKLSPSNMEHAKILDLFGVEKFIATQNSNYDGIEAVGREIGKITD
jgi:phosphonate transport system substrate-binding protein